MFVVLGHCGSDTSFDTSATEAAALEKEKPKKPYPDFPLFPHPNGCWAKKIRGKPCYFGPWADPDGALKRYLDEKDDLYAGRQPRRVSDGITVKHALNSFLASKESLLKSGELSGQSWDMYEATCKIIGAHMDMGRIVCDLQPIDFIELREKLAKGVGLVTLGIRVRIARMVFKHAYDAGLIDNPVRIGPQFKGPSKQNLRIEKNSKPVRMLESQELRAIIDKAQPPFLAMILLGVNCGFGQSDCARLTKSAVDLVNGWIEFPRAKTGVRRKCKLWPETVAALEDVYALARRPASRGDANLVFLTRRGQRYVDRYADGGRRDAIGQRFTKLQSALNLKRRGVGFYTLRHVFETIAGESMDQPAVDKVMGHAPHANDMGANYRERVSDLRLEQVAERVRTWLYSNT